MLSELFQGAFVQPEPLYSQGPPPIDSVPELVELHESPVVGWGKKKDKKEEKKSEPVVHTYQEKTEAEMWQMVMDVPLLEEDDGQKWEKDIDI